MILFYKVGNRGDCRVGQEEPPAVVLVGSTGQGREVS